jgi:type IX secretion system PorP/SprF family membrane protein
MKKSLLLIALATVSIGAVAQQDPQYTQWMWDRVSFNPAAAGMDKMHCLTIFHRDQWDGFNQDPKTYMFNYQGAFGEQKNVGIGMTAYSEVLGQMRNTIMRVAGNYHYNYSGNNFVSGGISLGVISSLLGTNWIANDQNDPTIQNLGLGDQTFDLNLGFMAYQPGKYYAGLSFTHLNGGDLTDLSMKVPRHFYLMGGYELGLGSNDLVLRPNVLLKSDFNRMQLDVNANVLWKQMLWAGIAFRPGDAIAPYVGFQKMFNPITKKTSEITHGIKMGYSYDATLSAIKDYSAGSHEIFLTYCWSKTEIPVRKKHRNPRFL